MSDEEIRKHLNVMVARELERNEFERSLGEAEYQRRLLSRRLKGVYALFDVAAQYSNPELISGNLRAIADEIDQWFENYK